MDTASAPLPLQFEEEQLRSYSEDPEFNYERDLQQDNWWTRFKRYVGMQYKRFMEWIFGDYKTNSFLRFIIEILPYLVLAGVLYLAVWVFSRMNPAAAMLASPEQGGVSKYEEVKIDEAVDVRIRHRARSRSMR